MSEQPLKTRAPRGLGDRGKALWRRLNVERDTPEGNLAMEACRIADRLDSLHIASETDNVLEIAKPRVADYTMNPDDGVLTVEIEIKVDGLMSEIRQQQIVLHQLVMSLTKLAAERKKAENPDAEPGVTPGSGPGPKSKTAVDEFTQRRKQRGA